MTSVGQCDDVSGRCDDVSGQCDRAAVCYEVCVTISNIIYFIVILKPSQKHLYISIYSFEYSPMHTFS